jgi:ZIP family zinc transporter
VAEAFFWGLIGALSLLIGAIVAIARPPSRRSLGLIMGFGAGVLISALSFELVGKAATVEDGMAGITFGLLVGCAVFVRGDIFLERRVGPAVGRPDAPGPSRGGLSIALGALLDGVPECAVLGLTILQGGSVGAAMLVAVFISNLPEGIAATTTLREAGWATARTIRLWVAVVAICALASPLGYALLDGASAWVLAAIFAFAAGAILTMLATSMMPMAYDLAGRFVGPVTVAGFALAFGVNWIAG